MPGPGAMSRLCLLLLTAAASYLSPGVLAAGSRLVAVSGESVSLQASFSGDATLISWTFQSNKVVDVTPDSAPDYYAQWEERAVADMSGTLTIRDLRRSDSGAYKAEAIISQLIQPTSYELVVYDPVPAPVITNTSEGYNMTLLCNSSAPDVTYRWLDSAGTATSTEQTVTIARTPGDPASNMTCVASNPASENSTTVPLPGVPHPDTGRSRVIMFVLLGFGVAAILVLLGIRLCVRDKDQTSQRGQNKDIPRKNNEKEQQLNKPGGEEAELRGGDHTEGSNQEQ